MSTCRKRTSNEGLQEKTFELIFVYYTAMRVHFHFDLLDHNSSPELHNKNFLLHLKKCWDVTNSTFHLTEQPVLHQTAKISIQLNRTSTDSIAVQLLLPVSLLFLKILLHIIKLNQWDLIYNTNIAYCEEFYLK